MLHFWKTAVGIPIEGDGMPRSKRLPELSTDELYPGSDYSFDEIELMRAIEKFKAETGIHFPSWSQVLYVIQGLGYRKQDPKTNGHKHDKREGRRTA